MFTYNKRILISFIIELNKKFLESYYNDKEYNNIFIKFLINIYFIGRVTGLEPANGGTTTHCLNHLATPAVVRL